MARCRALAALITLQLIISQADGQEACSAKETYILCPLQNSTFDVKKSDVWFKFTKENEQLDITCEKPLSAEQLEKYLKSVPKLREDSAVNLTTLTMKGCPAPGESFANESRKCLMFIF